MAACSIQTTLANILQRLRILEENQSRNNSVIAKLRLEMEDGSSRIQELEFSHESVLTEINCLLQRFGEQIATSRRKEQEKLRAAFVRLREEIEEERNTCRLLKLQNKKLMKELDEANIMAADAGEELDRERQARELMEEVCNELAREIGEDKAEVEQLKQEQAKSIQIVEEELKLIRMASLWRDERVKAKLSQVQFEHDDKRHVGVSLADLKSRVEEFVSSVSAASGEPYKAPSSIHKVNKDELKQMKMIEQAKLLRQALELSIQPVAGDGGLSQAHNDMDLKEEKSMTPIIEGQPIHTDACDCCINTIDDCKNLSMRYNGSYCELQVRPTNSMPNYSKKPSRDIRRPRMVVGDGLLDQNTTIIPHARRHLKSQHDIDVETEQECGPRRILLNSSFSQAAHQSPNPDFILYEGDGIRLAACKHKEQGSLTAVSIGGRGELCQGNELGFESSNCTPCMKEMVHRKQITLHFEGSEDSNEENAEAWEDDLTPNVGSAQGCSEDDASYACMDEQSGFSTRQQNRRGHPASCQHMKKQANGIHPWKSSGIHEEHLRRGHGGIDYHVDCLMQHEYDVAKSICADEAESGEGEHGEFDGFYFEPVIDDGSREDHQMTHHAHEPDVNGHMSVADHDDEPVDASPRANDRAVQHSRSSKELALKSVLHDSGGGWTSARSSAKTSRREEAPPPLPPHKLVLPTPSAIRVPSVKALYTSPRSAARSLSPSKAQVLQCFRPSPTSPEHNSAKLTSPVSSKNATKGEGMGTQHTGGSSGSWASKACLLRASSNNRAFDRMREEEDAHCANEEIGEQGQGKEACGSSRGAVEEKKGNSLRAELIKARELDLQQYGEHGNVNAKNAAAEAPPSAAAANKSASSSLRLSPIRRSLTSSSSQTSR